MDLSFADNSPFFSVQEDSRAFQIRQNDFGLSKEIGGFDNKTGVERLLDTNNQPRETQQERILTSEKRDSPRINIAREGGKHSGKSELQLLEELHQKDLQVKKF